MKSGIAFITGMVFFTACSPAKKQAESLDSAKTSTESVPVIQLTEAQKKDGWKLLFDGQTLNGWRIYQNKENNSWEATGGMLHCRPFGDRAVDKRSDLITVDKFGNFELTLDWKIAPQGNSGVIYRATEDFDQPYLSGPEYQVLDDEGYPAKIENWQKTAANYAMHEPAGVKPNAVGEWNSARIVVNGNHVEHWLNGVKAVEYELGSDDWQKRKAKGKWSNAAGYGSAKNGHIDLQDHGTEAWFRNIMIKEL